MHERVFPPDYVAVGPPVLPKWMVRLSDQHSMEALCFFGCVVNPKYFQLIEAFQIKANAAFFAVDLDNLVILAASGKTGRLERAQCPITELNRGNERIVDIDRNGGATVWKLSFLDERCRQCAH